MCAWERLTFHGSKEVVYRLILTEGSIQICDMGGSLTAVTGNDSGDIGENMPADW